MINKVIELILNSKYYFDYEFEIIHLNSIDYNLLIHELINRLEFCYSNNNPIYILGFEIVSSDETDLYEPSKKTQKSLASVMNLTKSNSNLVLKYIV